MMKSAKMILPLMVFTASAFSAFAQDNSGGASSIPESQLSAVKDRCSELQAQQGTTGSNEPETTQPERQTNQPGNDGSTASGNTSASTGAGSGDAAGAAAGSGAAASADSNAAASNGAGSSNADNSSQGEAAFDISSITLQDCIDQGLVDNDADN